jgi:hypothetical protein
LRTPGPSSDRRVILLKGPQGWVYRGLVGLNALALCTDVLQEYTIAIYLAAPEVVEAATVLSQKTGIPVDIIPYCSHEEMLAWHGKARLSIGLAMSDGISTSFLEAIVMGSFPGNPTRAVRGTGLLMAKQEFWYLRKIRNPLRRPSGGRSRMMNWSIKPLSLTKKQLESGWIIRMYNLKLLRCIKKFFNTRFNRLWRLSTE